MSYRVRIASICLAVAVGTLVPLGVAAAAQPPPALSISIDDGRSDAATGDELAYTIRIDNAGQATVGVLRLTQTLPPGFRFVSASNSGKQAGDLVEWTVTAVAGGQTTVTSKAVLDSVPEDSARFATSACAYLDGATRPVTCATDSNALPAQTAGRTWAYYFGIGLIVLATAGLAYWLLRRRTGPAVESADGHAGQRASV